MYKTIGQLLLQRFVAFMDVMDHEELLRAQMDALRLQHRELDQEIAGLVEAPVPDQLLISRLKKRKLQLKDQIARIEDQLYPDIIA